MSSRTARGAVSAAAVCAIAGLAVGQENRVWFEGVDGTFSDGSRWSPAGTPTPLDNVFINVAGIEGAAYDVSLDEITTINNFELDTADATFNVGTFGFGTTGNFLLNAGRTRGDGIGAGSVLVSGNATLTNGVLEDMDTFAVLGDATVSGMTVSNINTFTSAVGGTLTLEDTMFMGVGDVIVESSLLMSTGSSDDPTEVCIDDTCVDSRGTARLEGPGALNIGDGGAFDNSGLFAVAGDDNNSIMGSGASPGMFKNSGTFVKESAEGRGGAPTTVIGANIDFDNTGTVQVEGGVLQFQTFVTSDGVLSSGTWNVFNGSSLMFDQQQIIDLENGAVVNLQGSNTTFGAIETLRRIGQGSRFEIGSGRNFLTFQSFTNVGTLTVGDKSTFDVAESGFTNYTNGVLFDGVYDIAGTVVTPSNDVIQFLEADVTLRGVNSVFANLDPLQTVGSQGSFAVVEGRVFQTFDDFEVQQGGRVVVGDGSTLAVNGELVNFASGLFDDGFFEVAGTLQAQGISIDTISNELILDGTESQFLNEFGQDALSALQCIATDGILRLRNGRTLTNLDSLKVEGVLEIDPASGRFARSSADPIPQITTAGGVFIEGDAEVIMHLDGTASGAFASVGTDGSVAFSDAALVGSRLSVIIGDDYTPVAGDEFILFQGSSIDGAFAFFGVEGLDPALGAELLYSASTISVVITPAPGTAGVLALAGITAARRRRR